MTGSWDSVTRLYFLNGRGGGQSEHERERKGGRKGQTLQPAHTRTGLPSLWIRVWAEAKGKTALNSAHLHVHVYTPTVQSEHERERKGGRKGRTLQPAHTRTGVPSLWIRVWAEAREKTALNSAHLHVHVYTPTVQLRWQIRRGAHFQRILISATARTLSLRRLRDSARGLSKEYPGRFVSS